MNRKKSVLEIRYDEGEKLTDDETKELISEINDPLKRHPLLALYYGGYRLYHNTIDWTCHFCGEKIEVHKGYWGCKEMRWSEGAKLCPKCFLKFLLMIEDNEYLMLLLEKLSGKELEILDWFASQDRSE
jgi:hypothetical protein